MSKLRQLVVVCLAFVLFPVASRAQESAPFSTVGIGVKASLLGFGAEVATPLIPRFNLRAGFNGFGYDRSFRKDGINYAGQLNFRSAEAHLDFFPFGGSFHISPGALLYDGNKIDANASVSGGQTFTLNGITYSSDSADPVIGTGKIDFKKVGPILTVGFGNLVRKHHRFSIPFEIGAIYTGAPRAALNLTGSACDSTGLNCSPIVSDPSIQNNIQAEQAKINKDTSTFKFYPVISLGFGVKF